MTRRITASELAAATAQQKTWVTLEGHVYDVTHFVSDHPGGSDLLLSFAGMDVGGVMKDGDSHVHSKGAYEYLKECRIGTLEDEQTEEESPLRRRTGRDSAVDTSPSPEKMTSNNDDIKGPMTSGLDTKFLDLTRPLMPQMMNNQFKKSYYLDQVHRPRFMGQPARFFASSLLEIWTRTPWFIVPILWIPVASYCVYLALAGYTLLDHKPIVALSVPVTFLFVLMGFLQWSAYEYGIHRFLFHVERFLPDHPKALFVHFLLHGVHHFLPMDRYRLVMPPALALPLSFIPWSLTHVLVSFLALPAATVNALFAGIILGYVHYDLTHYYLHHGKPFIEHLREMKNYHVRHHYVDPNRGFGITHKVLDRLFGTLLLDEK